MFAKSYDFLFGLYRRFDQSFVCVAEKAAEHLAESI
jgi:hypothetical protein